MEKLNDKEIENIADLLLSSDEGNTSLALQLLEHNQYVIPKILQQVEVFAFFNPQHESILDWIRTTNPDYYWTNSPIYILYLVQYDVKTLSNRTWFLEQFEAQGAAYEQWIVQDSSRAIVYAKLATVIANQLEDTLLLAIKYYKLALKYLPNSGETHRDMANLLYLRFPKNEKITRYKELIIEAYEKAFDKLGEEGILINLSNFYLKDLEDNAQACTILEKAQTAFPKSTRVLTAYANYCIGVKDWAKAKTLALRSYEAAKLVYYDNEKILNTLGLIEWKGFGQHEAAQAYFAEALAENEYYNEALENAIALSLESQDYPNAIKWYEFELKSRPVDILLFKTLAELYLKIEEKEKAEYYYKKILRLRPNYSPAVDALAKLK